MPSAPAWWPACPWAVSSAEAWTPPRVLGVASATAEGPVAAFTVGFERRRYDETAGARGMAEAAGAEHAVVTLDDAALADHFADAVWHAETLQYNTHGVARYLLARSVREAGYRAVMAGEGADEAFFGYEFLRAAGGARGGGGGPRRILRLLGGLVRSPREALPGPGRRIPLAGAHRAHAPRRAVALHAPRPRPRPPPVGLLGGPARRPCRIRPLPRLLPALPRERPHSPAAPPRGQLLYLWLHSLFVNYHLAADRLDMAHGVEVRLPFLDHGLFEYANGLPLALLTAPPREKQLLREAMRPHIPNPVYARTKRAFMAPSAVGTDGPLHDFLQDTLRGAALRAVPLLDAGAVAEILDRLPHLAGEDRPSVDSPPSSCSSSLAVLQERYGL